MSKRKRNFTENRRIKLIKEGRGSGTGSEYLPWIKIQDVSSKGRSTRLKGIKTKRQHEFLSDMERDYFYILEFSDIVMDIREQFPLLPIDETILIAKELGIEHPKDPKTKELIVMTTDFLVTSKRNNNTVDFARTIKSYDDLMDSRIIEKFEIERRYWEKRGIDWAIVSEQEINKTVAKNISYVHNYHSLRELDALKDIDSNIVEDLILGFTSKLLDEEDTIRNISNNFDRDFMLIQGTGLSIFRYLIINKIIDIDIFKPIDVNKNIKVSISQKEIDGELKVI